VSLTVESRLSDILPECIHTVHTYIHTVRKNLKNIVPLKIPKFSQIIFSFIIIFIILAVPHYKRAFYIEGLSVYNNRARLLKTYLRPTLKKLNLGYIILHVLHPSSFSFASLTNVNINYKAGLIPITQPYLPTRSIAVMWSIGQCP
jgi:hypothetical protein